MATGLRAAALAQPTGLRAAALAPVPAAPAAAPQGQAFGNPMFGRTAIGQVARTVGDAAKFGSRLGLPTGDFAQRAYNVADGVEPVPETGVAADVVRGVASLPTAMLAIPAMGEQAAQAAEKQGASPNAALAIGTGVGIASGALEMVVPAMLAKTVTKGAATGLRALAMGALKTAGVEGATEGTQQVLQNVIPAIGESDPSKLTEGVAYNAGIGALVGGGAGGAATGVAGQPAAPLSPALAPEVAPPRWATTSDEEMMEIGKKALLRFNSIQDKIVDGKEEENSQAHIDARDEVLAAQKELHARAAAGWLRPVAATPEAEQAALGSLPETPVPPPQGISPRERDMAVFEQVQDLTPEQLDAEVENARGAEMRDFIAVFGSEAEAKRYQSAVRRQDSIDPNTRDRAIATVEAMESGLNEVQQARLYGTDGALIIQPEDVRPYRNAAYDVDGATDIELSREAGLAMTKLPVEGKDRNAWDERERVAAFTFRRAMAEAQSRGLDMAEFKKNAMKAGASRFSDPADAEFMLQRFLPKQAQPQEAAPAALAPPIQRQLPPPTESPAQAPVGPTAGTPDARPGVRSDIAPSNIWTTPLIDRVEAQNPVGREIATRARLASDTSGGSLRGRWQLATKPIRTSLRGFSFRGPSETLSQRRTRKELNQSRDVAAQDTSGPLASYEFAKFQEAVENDEALAALSPQAQRAVKSFRDFVMQTGEDVAAVRTPEGGPILMQTEEGLLPFRGAEGGRRLIRQWTPELHEVMRAGDSSPAYRALAQALGEANGLDGDAALARLNGIRQQIVEKKSAVEIARTFKNFPSAIRLRNGVRVPLLQTDPMHAATSIVESLSKRVGYIQQFGQGNEGKSLGERLREDFVRQGGEQTDVDNLIRSLQGMPVDQPLTTARPGTWAGEGLRVADTATQVGNAALLTRSFVPNIFESASKTPVVGGIKRSLKGYGQMARMAVDPTFRKDLMTDIERRGWHTIDVLDWMLTPGRKMESAGKIAGNFLTGPAHTVNEMNDVHAALTARSMVNDLAAGNGTGMDRTRLELLQFTPQQIDTVMAGNPTPETQPLFDAVGRRVVSYSQGSTSMPAELSRLGNSNKYKRVVAFDRYAQFTADRLFRQIRAIADAKTPAQAGKHAALLGQSVVGHTIAGSGAVLLGSLLKDGVVGLADTVRHATAGDDEKEKLQSFATFLADAGQYAMMGGAADTIYRASESGSSADFAKTLVSGTIPGRYTLDFVDWYNGQGRYKNKSGVDNALAFAERNLPIWPVVGQAVSEMGLGKTDIRREVAIRRAWEFIRNNEGVGSGGVPADPIDKEAQAKSQAFGVAMKKLETALRDGNMADVPKLRGEVLKAGRESGKGPRASLYGKRIIPQINEKNRPAARKWMGEKNWQALEKYDALLTRYAETLPKGTP